MDKIVLFSEEVTPRLSFITNLIFNELLGFHVDVTPDLDIYRALDRAKLNYSNQTELEGVQLIPDGLLFEKDIQPKTVRLSSDWNGLPGLLVNDSDKMDVLSSSFYLVSRYEEYLPFEKDDHNRFPASESCLTKLDLLQRPIVNEWALALYDQLKAVYPEIDTTKRQFEYRSTLDIDQAWKFKNKGLFRNLGGYFRDIMSKNWEDVRDRMAVIFRTHKDPFYNYDWQDEVHDQYSTKVQYFVQIGNNGPFDKNIAFGNTDFKLLIKRLDATHAVDIHPSYQSNEDVAIMQREQHQLADLLSRDVHTSRQHYLMHTMPKTYYDLIDIGITEDHTMGYSTHMGFRAGIASPFHFFDLAKNELTPLRLIPFCVMDITPLHYMEVSVVDAKRHIHQLMDRVESVGGLFVSLWHNESLSETGRWKGWRTVYEDMIAYADEMRVKPK